MIGTFGSEDWRDLAHSRALPSALDARGIYPVHGETLAKARNEGADHASRAGYEWLCFLDADDELAPGYLAAIEAEISRTRRSYAKRERRMLVPQVQYVLGRKRYRPRFPREVPVEQGNWLVIGTVIPTRSFEEVGGFEEFPLYEDWALFARMQRKGGVPVRVPDAVYVAHRTPNSRNHPTRAEKLAAHDEISRAVWPERYEEAVA